MSLAAAVSTSVAQNENVSAGLGSYLPLFLLFVLAAGFAVMIPVKEHGEHTVG